MKAVTRERLERAKERMMDVALELQRLLERDHASDPDPEEDVLELWADDLRDAATLIEDLP